MPVAQAPARKFPNLRHKCTPQDDGRIRVESLSHPGEHYDVDLDALNKSIEEQNEHPPCWCDGFKYRKWCTHIDSAILFAVRRGFRNLETSRTQERRPRGRPS